MCLFRLAGYANVFKYVVATCSKACPRLGGPRGGPNFWRTRESFGSLGKGGAKTRLEQNVLPVLRSGLAFADCLPISALPADL